VTLKIFPKGAEGAICGNEERLSVYLEILDVISL